MVQALALGRMLMHLHSTDILRADFLNALLYKHVVYHANCLIVSVYMEKMSNVAV